MLLRSTMVVQIYRCLRSRKMKQDTRSDDTTPRFFLIKGISSRTTNKKELEGRQLELMVQGATTSDSEEAGPST